MADMERVREFAIGEILVGRGIATPKPYPLGTCPGGTIAGLTGGAGCCRAS